VIHRWCAGPVLRSGRSVSREGVAVVALELFSRFGFTGALRWLHVLFGIAWIGLLYYFNFVQVPAFAQLSAPARNEAIQKLASRALWWFRWAAVGTAIFGILITGATKDYYKDFFKRADGVSIFLGMIIALTMLANVWMFIWPNQRVVIANAANVLGGGQPDPAAAPAGRRAFLASRQNTLFSVSMLWFMVATSHFYLGADFTSGSVGGGKVAVFLIVSLIIVAVLEANALGYIGGTGAGPYKWVYESVQSVIISAFVLWAVLWLLSEILLKP
jgi:uncharacterized membrane protein